MLRTLSVLLTTLSNVWLSLGELAAVEVETLQSRTLSRVLETLLTVAKVVVNQFGNLHGLRASGCTTVNDRIRKIGK